jgi:hypothetical protein
LQQEELFRANGKERVGFLRIPILYVRNLAYHCAIYYKFIVPQNWYEIVAAG